jgi:hypothetical protein
VSGSQVAPQNLFNLVELPVRDAEQTVAVLSRKLVSDGVVPLRAFELMMAAPKLGFVVVLLPVVLDQCADVRQVKIERQRPSISALGKPGLLHEVMAELSQDPANASLATRAATLGTAVSFNVGADHLDKPPVLVTADR